MHSYTVNAPLSNFVSLVLSGPLTILEPQDQEIGEMYVVVHERERRARDIQAVHHLMYTSIERHISGV